MIMQPSCHNRRCAVANNKQYTHSSALHLNNNTYVAMKKEALVQLRILATCQISISYKEVSIINETIHQLIHIRLLSV